MKIRIDEIKYFKVDIDNSYYYEIELKELDENDVEISYWLCKEHYGIKIYCMGYCVENHENDIEKSIYSYICNNYEKDIFITMGYFE